MRRTLFGTLLFVALATNAAAESPEPVLALNGLDPIALIDGKEVPGLETIEITHGLFRYRFANPENKATFTAKPDDHGIQFGGACGKMGPFSGNGNPSRFYVHDRRIYVFASESCRDGFKRDPVKHIEQPNPVPMGTAEQKQQGAALVEKALSGFGGAARVDGLKSLKATVKHVYKSGNTETIGTKRVIWSFPRRVRIEEEFSTAYGFVIDGQQGAQFAGAKNWPMDMSMRDFGWRQALREPLAMLRNRDAKGFVAIAQGKGEVDGQSVELLAVALDGATSTWSIDAKSGRILQCAYNARRGVVGDVVVKYSDFREVDGLTLPHVSAIAFNGKPVASPEVRHDSFVVNGDIKPGVFTGGK